ncbi:MAG: transketolase [Chloroflexi bacterium HGW-Chloroflexi-5]|jgi:transketolase|nr:MAG: transketolase [Chloroflexi bacterium HGW-Chloroflexi-5]
MISTSDHLISREKTALLEFKSIQYRKTILSLIYSAKAGHTGGSLSCVDILNVLYNQTMNITTKNFAEIDRDHYVHSKGHSVEALYAVLLDQDFYTIDELNTIEKYDSPFIGHPTRSIPGIEQNTGALGHGLSISVGMALAAKMDHRDNRIFTIMGDGELTEGSIWEASASAANYKLDNLIAIVDRNTLQISGRTENVMAMESLDEKFSAFGFAVRHVDGNNVEELAALFDTLPFEKEKPNLVLAHTIKGKGISFMEDNVGWHHRVPTDEEYALAIQELDLDEQKVENSNG